MTSLIDQKSTPNFFFFGFIGGVGFYKKKSLISPSKFAPKTLLKIVYFQSKKRSNTLG